MGIMKDFAQIFVDVPLSLMARHLKYYDEEGRHKHVFSVILDDVGLKIARQGFSKLNYPSNRAQPFREIGKDDSLYDEESFSLINDYTQKNIYIDQNSINTCPFSEMHSRGYGDKYIKSRKFSSTD